MAVEFAALLKWRLSCQYCTDAGFEAATDNQLLIILEGDYFFSLLIGAKFFNVGFVDDV